MNHIEKSEVLRAMCEKGQEILKQSPVMAVAEFEGKLKLLFASKAEQLEMTIRGKRRTEFENLIDWVKARLTRAELILYRTVNGEPTIIYLEPVGFIAGVGKLVTHADAIDLIDAMLRCDPN